MFDSQQRALAAVYGGEEICFLPKMANRHGLITGATGTGKTITLQTLAETFSAMGVPVFAADVKGDLSGVASVGGGSKSVAARVRDYSLDKKGFRYRAFPVCFWDLFGEQGVPVRAAILDMGPLLLGRLLALNDTQSAVLTVVFKIAEDEALELVDIKDLRTVLAYVAANAGKYRDIYGNLASASIGAVQRGLTALEHEGADLFFGEPAVNIEDLLQVKDGMGVIGILAADRLMRSPKLYSTFLLWLLTRLFDVLPEVGDAEKPRLVFFFDEAHLLFNGAPKALVEKVEQVVRLIRSKGVGIFFISQVPADIPDTVLGQLGNRVQHALRAYTPKDMKALKAAAQSFRPNPAFDTETAVAELGTGEALISFLDAKGAPQPVERAFVVPPEGGIGPIAVERRREIVLSSPYYAQYKDSVDRTTAYELLQQQLAGERRAKERIAEQKELEATQKREEKARLAEEKQAKREVEQSKRFWSGIAKSVLVPVARRIVGGLFKKR